MYKIIVAGCGGMSDLWITDINSRSNCEIVGLVDINIDAANAKSDKFALNVRTYSHIEEALEKENANLVIDITVPEAHFNTVTTALKHGCNVFGEKPMSDSLENAEKMVACAEETGKDYFVMQNRRYVSQIIALKNFLLSGTLGDIGQVSANFQLNPHFGGFREDMNSPLIADMAIHTFDAAAYIMGSKAVSVYCHEFNPHWSWYRGAANAVCIFEMENGAVFDYRGSWCANGINTSWESEWRIACEKGAVYWDGADKLFYDSVSDNHTERGIEIPAPQIAFTGHAGCIQDMFDALDSGKKPQTDCRENINSVRMVYKAIESAANGHPVVI